MRNTGVLSSEYLGIEDILEISYQGMKGMPSIQVLIWNNYITILNEFYPGLWNQMSFATQKDGDIPMGWKIHEPEAYELPANIEEWLSPENKVKSVLNLDVDYFFMNYKEGVIQIYADEYIRTLAREIRKAWNNIEVFTICLSPECCGGWDQAIRVANIITDELGIGWEMK